MKKIKSKAGYIALKATSKDMKKFDSAGRCDYCNVIEKTGYLIPILNSYYCPECYKNWDDRNTTYDEKDSDIEEIRLDYYEEKLESNIMLYFP